jgi:hypothetical protein
MPTDTRSTRPRTTQPTRGGADHDGSLGSPRVVSLGRSRAAAPIARRYRGSRGSCTYGGSAHAGQASVFGLGCAIEPRWRPGAARSAWFSSDDVLKDVAHVDQGRGRVGVGGEVGGQGRIGFDATDLFGDQVGTGHRGEVAGGVEVGQYPRGVVLRSVRSGSPPRSAPDRTRALRSTPRPDGDRRRAGRSGARGPHPHRCSA